MAVLIAILGTSAIITMPVDIFPYIDIPVVSVVWSYQRAFARRDGKAHGDHLRAGHDHHRERHRAHRIAVVQRRFGHASLLPAEREGGNGACAGDRHLPDAAAHFSARHHAAQHPQIRRLERPHPAAGAGKQDAERAGTVRPGPELHPHPAGHHPGRFRSPALRREVPLGHGGPDAGPALRQRAVSGRCDHRARQPEPDSSGRRRQDRRSGIPGPDQQQSPDAGRDERPAAEGGERRHGVSARRGPGARRLFRADQHRAHQRHARRAADGDAQRQGIHAGGGEQRQERAAEDSGRSAHRACRSASCSTNRCSCARPSTAWCGRPSWPPC